MSSPDNPLKVYLLCTGVNGWRGGIETFARECFDGLHGAPGLHIELFKGSGANKTDEHRVWCIQRRGVLARTIGFLARRPGYWAEQMSSFLPIVRRIRRGRPDIVFTSDPNLENVLLRFRKWIGVPFRLIHSNGGPLPPPYVGPDHIHQVAPYYLEEAMRFGESADKHSMVPYGISVQAGPPVTDQGQIKAARVRLDLPLDRKIVISVGWISATHKRMDYTIREIARLPEPRPFLLLLGRMDHTSPPIHELAAELLGAGNYLVRSVPYEEVNDYYLAADAFVLASLTEGFGRVYLEALIQGLACIVHDHPVMRYVLEEEGIFANLKEPGAMAGPLEALLKEPQTPEAKIRRREYVRRRFDWTALVPEYIEMFRKCMRNSPAAF